MQNRFRMLLPLAVTLLVAACASPTPAPVRDRAGAFPTGTAAAQLPPTDGLHVVQRGETLLSIARQYGVTLPELVRWNQISDPDQIHVGQSVRVAPEQTQALAGIPAGEAAVATPVPGQGMAGEERLLKQAPLGGREPYTDGAWAALAPAGSVPAVVEPAAESVAEQPAEGSQGSGTAGGMWAWPAQGELIATYDEASSKGVDIAGKLGDPVRAAAAGKVAYAGSGLRGYGKLVVIKHSQDFTSVYAHNDKLLVKEDDQVQQGQKIAELGSSEADRPKLHFEIRKLGRAIDPLQYLPAR